MKGCSEVVLPVVDALRDGDVRHEAAVTLGVLKDRRAVPGLIGVLGDPNPEVRLEAAHSLGLIGDPSAAPCLAPLLRDDDVQVRRYAVAALAWLARDGLADQRTVGAFILAMADYDSLVRSWAARGAGYCRDSRVIAPLTDLLATDEQEVSRCAAKALVTHGADPAILRLPTFRPSAEAVTRAVAVLRDPRTVPPLLEALKDPDPAVRACAAEALGPFKAREAFEPLLSLLDDPFPGVRAGAAQSLGALGDRRAIPSLISLLHDERITADTSEALRKLTGQDFGDNPAAWQAWWEQNKGAEPGINTISPR
jgi:HEAT repeat protein